MRKLHLSIFILFFLLLGACSSTKNIPEGKFLLNKVNVETDNDVKAASDLEVFIKQQPNGSAPLLGKVGLRVYNMAGKDTSKWINRAIQKMGEEPVVYNERATASSLTQLRQEMSNMGYLNAQVDTIHKWKNKKVDLTYSIKTGEPYRIRNYVNAIQDTTIARIVKRVAIGSVLNPGELFNMEMLEEERVNVASFLRNVGYYNFSKEYVYFKADTTLNSHQVDLYMNVYPAPDSLPYQRYKIDKVKIISGFNMTEAPAGRYFRNADTTYYKDIEIIRGRRQFLRTSTIQRNNYLRKGMYYSDYLLSRTYENFNGMGAVKQTNITISPSSTDSARLLDATIVIASANAHWFRAGLDGTNSAGDIGIAPSVAYQHQNLFNGAEVLNIRLKGAYEFINGSSESSLLNQNYYEYGIETSLTYPLFLAPWLSRRWREMTGASTKFTVGLNNQLRSEYSRQFFNASVGYGWTSKRRAIRHNLEVIDVNYVRMPWVSQAFKDEFLNDTTSNQLLKASYANQLIARTSYSISITNRQRFRKLANSSTFRGAIEVAGVLPHLATALNGAKPNADGRKELLGVEYAEYVKGTVDFSQTIPLSSKHTIAYHVGIGVAYPYSNSAILPFERRFFAGGANSLRGWSTRSLGPGSYRRSKKSASDFVNQTGDIKFEASVESRHKVGGYLELAAFVDAGNIWTIHNYEDQPGGMFQLNRFYREIALSYGLGLRFDLGFLLLRLDAGARAYDPEMLQGERIVIHKPRLSRMAWHFGIGYPF